MVQGPRQSAGARTDRHLIVVEDDKQLFVQPAGVIERLVNDARRQGAIAYDGDAIAVILAAQLVADLETQGARDTASRMSGHEQIESALVRVGITHQPALGANGIEAL